MAQLRVFTGRSLELSLGGERVFGRADTHTDLDSVSREQFKLACTADGVVVTSLSAVNPTKVLLRGGPAAQQLAAGESELLSVGDRVLLMAGDPSMFVELAALPAAVPADSSTAQSSAPPQAAVGDNEPPSKRQRAGDQAAAAAAHPGGQQATADAPAPEAAAAAVVAAAAAPGPVMLVLVGVQGAGKSTFCHALMQRSQEQQQAQPQQAQGRQQGGQQAQRQWVRINQDTIADGKRGTREQCLEAARQALGRGDSVLIDRTNVTQDQRRPFVRLAAQQGAQAHCLVLKLPRKLCMDRAAARTAHEGDLQGKAVYPAISRMHSEFTEAGDPQPREGFASVLICESDGDVAAALDAWVLFGPAHADPAAEYARLRPPPPPPPVLNTLDRYFKKGSSGGASGSGGGTGSKNKAAGPAAAPAGGKQQQQQQPGTGPAAAAAAAAAGGGGGPAAAPAGGSGASKVDAFKLLMSPKPHPPASAPPAKAGPSGGSGGGGSRHTWKAGGPFANSLTKIAADPESCRCEQLQLWFDDRAVWIADKFPKAQQHWLVVARDARLGGPLDLAPGDAPLVEHMLAVARERTAALQPAQPLVFRCGFHSVPSLRQLHMHVDFDAPGLKTKKHWNSFTSAFFLDAEAVLAQLRAGQPLSYSLEQREALLGVELRCHRCGGAQPNMPRLKQHIAACAAPLPQC